MKRRLFVAVDVSPSVREGLRSLAERLGPAAARDRVRAAFVAPEKVHLTLAFLGAVEEERVPQIERALSGVAFAPIALVARGAGVFPNARRPRVLWAGLGGDTPALAALQGAVAEALAPLGFEPEKRPFAPHLTVARIKVPRPAPALAAELLAAGGLDLGAWTVDELRLYESRLRPGGAEYAVIRAWRAGGGG